MNLLSRTMKMQKLGIFNKGIVNDGIEDPDTQAISWSPGDGFRYNIIFNILPESIHCLIGGSEHHILVSYYDGFRIVTWPLIKESTQVVDYIAKCFGMDSENNRTKYLTTLINMTIGNFDYGYELYKELK